MVQINLDIFRSRRSLLLGQVIFLPTLSYGFVMLVRAYKYQDLFHYKWCEFCKIRTFRQASQWCHYNLQENVAILTNSVWEEVNAILKKTGVYLHHTVLN